ncbi:MAG: right-handed parallel beta-helix repeat-containing protein [Caldilineaceae bacterium]
MEQANADPAADTIIFDIIDDTCGSDGVLHLLSPLPTVDAPLVIDGTQRDDGTLQPLVITLDGSQAATADGLVITGGGAGSTITGLTVVNFGGSGIVIGAPGAPSDNNVITGNTSAFNGDDGITVFAGVGNQLRGNDIHDNGDLDIDLGGDGRTPNDVDDLEGPAEPSRTLPRRAHGGRSDGGRVARLAARAGVHAPVLRRAHVRHQHPDAADPDREHGRGHHRRAGRGLLSARHGPARGAGLGVACHRDRRGNTSELSDCILVSVGNDSWPRALQLLPGNDPQLPFVTRSQAAAGQQTWTVQQHLDQFGQARWYRFAVQPDSQVLLTLENLPADYDLTLFTRTSPRSMPTCSRRRTRPISIVWVQECRPRSALRRSVRPLSPSAFSRSAFQSLCVQSVRGLRPSAVGV